jgi:hypothetical protein
VADAESRKEREEKKMVISSGRLAQLHCGRSGSEEEGCDLEWKCDKENIPG